MSGAPSVSAYDTLTATASPTPTPSQTPPVSLGNTPSNTPTPSAMPYGYVTVSFQLSNIASSFVAANPLISAQLRCALAGITGIDAALIWVKSVLDFRTMTTKEIAGNDPANSFVCPAAAAAARARVLGSSATPSPSVTASTSAVSLVGSTSTSITVHIMFLPVDGVVDSDGSGSAQIAAMYASATAAATLIRSTLTSAGGARQLSAADALSASITEIVASTGLTVPRVQLSLYVTGALVVMPTPRPVAAIAAVDSSAVRGGLSAGGSITVGVIVGSLVLIGLCCFAAYFRRASSAKRRLHDAPRSSASAARASDFAQTNPLSAALRSRGDDDDGDRSPIFSTVTIARRGEEPTPAVRAGMLAGVARRLNLGLFKASAERTPAPVRGGDGDEGFAPQIAAADGITVNVARSRSGVSAAEAAAALDDPNSAALHPFAVPQVGSADDDAAQASVALAYVAETEEGGALRLRSDAGAEGAAVSQVTPTSADDPVSFGSGALRGAPSLALRATAAAPIGNVAAQKRNSSVAAPPPVPLADSTSAAAPATPARAAAPPLAGAGPSQTPTFAFDNPLVARSAFDNPLLARSTRGGVQALAAPAGSPIPRGLSASAFKSAAQRGTVVNAPNLVRGPGAAGALGAAPAPRPFRPLIGPLTSAAPLPVDATAPSAEQTYVNPLNLSAAAAPPVAPSAAAQRSLGRR